MVFADLWTEKPDLACFALACAIARLTSYPVVEMTPDFKKRRTETPVGANADPVERIEALAGAIGDVIETSPAGDREALYELAVRRVSDLPVETGRTAVTAEARGARDDLSAGGLVAYGALIAPLGLLVATVLPLGAVLVLAGGALILVGLLWSGLSALRSRFAAVE